MKPLPLSATSSNNARDIYCPWTFPSQLLARLAIGFLAGVLLAYPALADDEEKTGADLLTTARASVEGHAEEMGGGTGLLVLEVFPDSQGEAAGLRRGDILLRYASTALDSTEDLTEATSRTVADAVVTLELLRDGEVLQMPLRGGPLGVRIRSLSIPKVAMSRQEFLAAFTAALEARDTVVIEDLLRRHGKKAQQTHDLLSEIGTGEGEEAAEARTLGALLGRLLAALAAESDPLRPELDRLQREGEDTFYRADYATALARFQEGLERAKAIGSSRYRGQFLTNIGLVYTNLGEYQRALDHHEQALTIHREIGDRRGEGRDLINIGNVYHNLGQYQHALKYFEQALVIDREIGDRRGEEADLGNIGAVYASLGQYQHALEHFEQALAIRREIGDRRGEGASLSNIGLVYANLGQYQRALEHYEKALAIDRELGNRRGEGDDLTNIGAVYANLSRYEHALEQHEQALVIHREIGDRRGESGDLSNIGLVYANLGQYQRAQAHYEQALAIRREIGDRRGEGADLGNIGNVYYDLGQYQRALKHYEQALTIRREIGDRRGEGADLSNIGKVYANLGQYQRALENYGRALTIRREIGDRRGEGGDLSNTGLAYANLGQYQRALELYRQALTIRREIGDQRGEGGDLSNIGLVYRNLGQYQHALEQHEQALVIHREIGDRRGESGDLSNIGLVHANLGQYQRALKHYEQALTIRREIGDRRGEGADLSNIGKLYFKLGQFQRALELHKQALTIRREIGDRRGEGDDLLNIGLLRQGQGDSATAITLYREALAIQTEVGAPESLWRIWSALSESLAAWSDPTAAIIAGKRAVNTIQAMRVRIQELEQRLQRSFLADKDIVYRRLANRLIADGRLVEAQQVLHLRNEAELYEYEQAETRQDLPSTIIALNTVEADWQQGFDAIAAELRTLSDELATFERVEPGGATEGNQARIDALSARHKELKNAFDTSLDEMITRFGTIDSAEQDALDNAMTEQYGEKRRMVAALSGQSGTRTALYQTLVLSDKVHLLLTTATSSTHSVVAVDTETLDQHVGTLYNSLSHPTRDPIEPAKVLYNLLIAPIEVDLAAQGIELLMVNLDGRLRYIPFGALHDGERWLIERMPIVFYSAASERREAIEPERWRVAAFGASKAHGSFPALPGVPIEIDAIVKDEEKPNDPVGILPGIARLDESFTLDALVDAASASYTVIHIASNFLLEPGSESDSYLLLGTGETLSLRDLRRQAFDLSNVDLVTLSSCDTAFGGVDSSGIEIEGMGTIFLRQGAGGVIVSLWAVDDQSTAWLMRRFYQLRSVEKLSKAEALRGAQIQLMHIEKPEAEAVLRGPPVRELTQGENTYYSHPYYWAPFILMGNPL